MRRLFVPVALAACLLVPGAFAFAGDDPPDTDPPTVAPVVDNSDIVQRANDATARFARRNFVRVLLRGGFNIRGRATLDAPPDTVCRSFVTARIPRGVCLFEIRISDRVRPTPHGWDSRKLHGGHHPPRPSQPIVVRHFECIGAVHVVLNPNAPLVEPLGVDCIRNPNTVEQLPSPGPKPHPYPTPVA